MSQTKKVGVTKSQTSKMESDHVRRSRQSKKESVQDKENTPPHPKYNREIRGNDCVDDDDDGDLNKSTLQRSLTYSKLNQSFSPSPKLAKTSGSNSRRGSDDTRRLSRESLFSVYEDCKQTLSRRPSYESVISVYEDCLPVQSRRPSQEDEHATLTIDDLTCDDSIRLSKENKRLSKESVISVYEDASEYLDDEYEDSLMMPPEKYSSQNNTPNKSGFSPDILIESYEVVEQIEEEIVTEEVKVTQTKIMFDSYEISTNVNVEVTRDTNAHYHEQVIKETFVHVDGNPQKYFPGISCGEKKFFPPIDSECEVMSFKYGPKEPSNFEDELNIRRDTVVINSSLTASNTIKVPNPHGLNAEEDFIRRDTVVLSKAPGGVCSNSAAMLNTQSPTKLHPPEHVTGDTSFSPLKSRFSPKSPQSDPNADPNESRRETVTMECPSPALVACHSRLIRAGHAGCVDCTDSITPVSRLRDLCNASPKSSTPLPGRSHRKIGWKRDVKGPSWIQEHLQEPPCSPVARLPLDSSPSSPRKALFSVIPEPEIRRISTQTITKTKPAVSQLSPISTRDNQSPVIDTNTVTKTRSSIGQFIPDDQPSKQFERTVDQSISSNNDNLSGTEDRRLSAVTVNKCTSNSIQESIPECVEDDLMTDMLSNTDNNMAPFSKSINSRTRSGSKKKRRSSGKIRNSSGRKRVIRSETVTKARSSVTPPVVNCPRKRLSSKKLFSPPPQDVPVMDESIMPFSPSPKKRLSAAGEAKLTARIKQNHESSLEFPVHHSKVTANLVQNKGRRSMDLNVKKPTERKSFRRSVDPSNLKSDTSKYVKRRSFGNKTLPTNMNRPVTNVTVTGGTSLKLTRTQQLRRNGKLVVSSDFNGNIHLCVVMLNFWEPIKSRVRDLF